MKRTYIAVLLAVVICFSACGGVKATTDWKTKQTLLQLLIDLNVSDTKIPGIVMGVKTSDGTWIGASGNAVTATKSPMTLDMQVRLASITKTFTATLIMKLVEENVLSLTDTVDRWLPGRVNRGSEITVQMLLNHTSGIHDYESDTSFWDTLMADTSKEWTSTEILQLVNAHALDFTPGTNFSYSNAGYYILGMIAEAAAGGGSTVQSLAISKIFTPANLSRTSMATDGTLVAPYSHEYGWMWTDSTLHDTTLWNFSWDWTAGCGVSTTADMINFIDALFGERIVNNQSLTAMTTVLAPAVNYGFGMAYYANYTVTGENTYTHGGENPGTTTIWLYMPDSQRTIFIELNRNDANLPDPTNIPVDANKVIFDLVTQAMPILNG